MKKLITLILAVAMLCSLASVISFAAEVEVPLYTAKTDDAGQGLWLGQNNTIKETSVTVKTLVSFSKVFIKEAWGSNGVHNLNCDIIKDGNVVGTATVQQDTNGGDLTFNFGKTFEPGVYTIKFYTDSFDYYVVLKKITEGDLGESYAVYDNIRFAFSIIFTEQAETYFGKVKEAASRLYTTENGGVTLWMSNDTSTSAATHPVRSQAAMFSTDEDIWYIGTPIFWTSWDTASNASQCSCDVTIKVWKFAYNYENSVAQTPVAQATFTSKGDNNASTAFSEDGTNCTICSFEGIAGIMLQFDEKLPAGQYIVEFTETTNNSEKEHYLVIPTAKEASDASIVKYYVDGEQTDEYATRIVVGVDEGGAFVALTAESDVPTDAPQTGDMTIAMFAVMSVIALAAIVVLKKRVNA